MELPKDTEGFAEREAENWKYFRTEAQQMRWLSIGCVALIVVCGTIAFMF